MLSQLAGTCDQDRERERIPPVPGRLRCCAQDERPGGRRAAGTRRPSRERMLSTRAEALTGARAARRAPSARLP
jgi:hypothetical protein